MQQQHVNLTFHGIGEPQRRFESGEENVWVSHDRFLSILDSAAGRSDVLRITFDDGNASDVDYALPALRQRGLSATFFVVADRLGTPGFLDRGGVRALAGAGMTIGCHGMRHRPWRRLDATALREEVVDAKRLLEEVVDAPVTRAACPFGSYDRRVLRALRRSGYQHVYTSDRGPARPDAWIQARNTIGPTDDAGSVEHLLASDRRAYDAVRRRAKAVAKQWR